MEKPLISPISSTARQNADSRARRSACRRILSNSSYCACAAQVKPSVDWRGRLNLCETHGEFCRNRMLDPERSTPDLGAITRCEISRLGNYFLEIGILRDMSGRGAPAHRPSFIQSLPPGGWHGMEWSHAS